VTLEFSNTTTLPAKIYANEGACQFIFLKGDQEPETSYADKKGKYMKTKRCYSSKNLNMQKLLIKGGKKLSGEVVISGSKNASLPIVISSLLFDDSVQFENVPKVKDIYTLINLIKVLGREVEFNEDKEVLKNI
jgi:hypothetical protein